MSESPDQISNLYGDIFSNIKVGLLIADKNGNCLDVNSFVCKILDYEKAELIGMPLKYIVSPSDVNYLKVLLDQITNNGNFKREWKLSRKDGVEFKAELDLTTTSDEKVFIAVRKIDQLNDLEENLDSKSKDLSKLLEISQSITSTLDIEKVLQKIVDSAVEIEKLDTGAIYLIRGNDLYLGATFPSLPENFPEEMKHDSIVNHPHIKESISSLTPSVIRDTKSAELSEAEIAISLARGLVSILYLPIVSEKRVKGILILGSTKGIHHFEDNDLNIFATFSNLAALAIENAELYSDAQEEIKEREKIQNSLIKSEKRLIDAQQIAKLGDFYWDVKTGAISWSEGMYFLLGYDKYDKIDFEQINKRIHHPDDYARVQDWLNNSIKSGKKELEPNEYRIIKKNGEVIHIRAVGIIEHIDNEPVRVFGTVQDVTEMKIANQLRTEAEQRYKTLFENQPTLIWLMDFSKIKKELDELKVNGFNDLQSYLNQNSSSVKKLLDLVRLVEINNTSTIILEAENKTDVFEKKLSFFFDSSEALNVFKELFTALVRGENEFERDLPVKTIKHNRKYLRIRLYILPENQNDLSRIILTSLDITEENKFIDELKKSREQIRAMFANLDNILEDERKLLARELHDELGQVLTSIKMNLSLMKNTIKTAEYDEIYLEKEINEMQSVLDSSNKTMKRLIQYLRPEYLDNLGLIIALEHLIEEIEKKSDIKIEFDNNFEKISLTPLVENTVFRVIQEAFTNVLKHSRADRVNLSLNLSKDKLDVEMIDNGIGFSDNKIDQINSFGILGMRERLHKINSDLIVNSSIGKGTKITFSIIF